LAITNTNVIGVINKRNINLDIIGPSGMYAIRLRNSEDEDWTVWINIDNYLYNGNDDIVVDNEVNAYFIDNNRILVPWEVPRINGVRRICCQILTPYGVTSIVCVQVFVNLDTPDYSVEFYQDYKMTIPVVRHGGYPIVSEKKCSDGTPEWMTEGCVIVDPIPDYEPTYIYIKVNFNESQTYTANVTGTGSEQEITDSELRFNAVQQGVGDQFDLYLIPIDANGDFIDVSVSTKTYKGSFKLYKDDGIFDKDGLGFIDIVFPENNIASTCQSDDTDKYNLMVSADEINKYFDIDPETAFLEYRSSQINKVLNIDSFKQMYNSDDFNFMFGNPKIYQKTIR